MRPFSSPEMDVDSELHGFQGSIAAVAMSSYFVDIFRRDFKPGSPPFAIHFENFLSGILGNIPMPSSISRDDVVERYSTFIKEILDEKKLVFALDQHNADIKRIGKMLGRYRAYAKQLVLVKEIFQDEEYPGELYVEVYRAISTYQDGIRFLANLFGHLFKTRAGFRSAPTPKKILEAKERVSLDFLGSFVTFLMEFSRLLLAVQIWSSASLEELFQIKTLRFDILPRTILDERLSILQDSVSSFREQLANLGVVTHSGKADQATQDSFREIALAMEVQ